MFIFPILIINLLEIVLLWLLLDNLTRFKRNAWWFAIFNVGLLRFVFYTMTAIIEGDDFLGANILTHLAINFLNTGIGLYGYWRWGQTDFQTEMESVSTKTTGVLDDLSLFQSESSGDRVAMFSSSRFGQYGVVALVLFALLVILDGQYSFLAVINFWDSYIGFLSVGLWGVGLFRLAERDTTGWYLLMASGLVQLVGFVWRFYAYSGYFSARSFSIAVVLFTLFLCWRGKNAWENETYEPKQII